MEGVNRCNYEPNDGMYLECGAPAFYRYYLRAYKRYRCSEHYKLEHNPAEWELLERKCMGPVEERLTATESLLKQRGEVYGDISDNMCCALEVMRVLKRYIEKNSSFENIGGMKEYDTYIGCLSMIVHKIARSVTGDVFYEDNYADIAGYAKLLQNKMREYAANAQSV